MAIWESPDGTRRTIPDGIEFIKKPGERVVPDVSFEEVKQAVDRAGLQVGDMIAALTKTLGIKPCASCEKRRLILNRIREIGLKDTITQLKETFKSE